MLSKWIKKVIQLCITHLFGITSSSIHTVLHVQYTGSSLTTFLHRATRADVASKGIISPWVRDSLRIRRIDDWENDVPSGSWLWANTWRAKAIANNPQSTPPVCCCTDAMWKRIMSRSVCIIAHICCLTWLGMVPLFSESITTTSLGAQPYVVAATQCKWPSCRT